MLVSYSRKSLVGRGFPAVVLAVLLFIAPSTLRGEGAGREYWVKRYLSVSYPLGSVRVTSSYGQRKDPWTGERVSHTGLDLKARFEPVYAMFAGTVEAVGSDQRSGNYVIIRHGVYTVSYCHLKRCYVRKGDTVIAGTIVAVSGNTGRSTGPHLHITARRDGKAVNPMTLLRYVMQVRHEAVTALGGKAPAMPLATPSEFIERYAPLAMEHQREYGIPASVTLAQMAYESDFGRSELAREGRNYFGIKCSRQWLAEDKPYSVHDDDRKGEKFCNYASAEESIEHHSRLLMGDRYSQCRRHSQTDYHGWLSALKKAGYATAGNYVSECEKIIRKYQLHRYDRLAMAA